MHVTRNVVYRTVRASITRQRKRIQKYFPLSEYQTWKNAEKAARAWIDGIIPSLPEPIPIKDRMTSRNNTGIVGVMYDGNSKVTRGAKYDFFFYKAFWSGTSSGISFGTVKYGEQGAFIRAIIARKLETTDRKLIENEYVKRRGIYKALINASPSFYTTQK